MHPCLAYEPRDVTRHVYGRLPYTQEECAQYVEHLPEIFYHAGTRIEKKEFLNSWECIVRHTSRLLENVRVDPPPNSELGLL